MINHDIFLPSTLPHLIAYEKFGRFSVPLRILQRGLPPLSRCAVASSCWSATTDLSLLLSYWRWDLLGFSLLPLWSRRLTGGRLCHCWVLLLLSCCDPTRSCCAPERLFPLLLWPSLACCHCRTIRLPTTGKYWIRHPQQIDELVFLDTHNVYLHSSIRYAKRNQHTSLSLYKTLKYALSFLHFSVDTF